MTRIVKRRRSRQAGASPPSDRPAPGETKGKFSKRLKLDMTSPLWPWKCPDCGHNMAQTAKRCNGCTRATGGRPGAVTSEERSSYPLCGAIKVNGEPCRAFAGQGTDHYGTGQCQHHVGNAPNQKIAAAKKQVLELVRAEAPLHDMTPEQAVMWILRLTAGRANYLENAIREETDEIRLAVFSAFRDQTFDRLLKISHVAMQFGLTDHETKVEQEQAAFVLWAIDSALTGTAVGNHERRIIGAFIRKLLAEQAEDADALAAATARLEELRSEGVVDADVVEEPPPPT